MNDLFRKLVLFLTGFCVYITIENCYRGYSFLLMGVVGGLSMLILDSVNNKLSWDIDLFLYGLIGTFSITTFELVIGELLKLFHQPAMWDYSNVPLNFDGVICLPFSIVWFFLSYIAVFLADAINYYVFEELPIPYYKLFGKMVIRFKEKHCKLK